MPGSSLPHWPTWTNSSPPRATNGTLRLGRLHRPRRQRGHGDYARPSPPNVPTGIDTVWVGLWQRSASMQSNASTLWLVTPPGPWQILEVPAVRNYANNVLERTVGRSAP